MKRKCIFKWSPRYICPILTKFGVSGQIFHKVPISNFTEMRPVLATQTNADGRMDMTKLKGAIHDYIIAFKKNFSSAIRADQLCGPAWPYI